MRRGGRLTPSTRRALLILPVWIGVSLWMWLWWLNAARVNFLPLFIPLTVALLYEFTVLPSLFLYFVFKAKTPPKKIAQKNLKVAAITLCVPNSESMEIIERQLDALTNITYPHDSWILDEGNSKEVKALAKKYKVKYFSRKGIAKYNQGVAPFKSKTKAGNVNAWIDRVKRYKYDYFVQFDIDHNPKPNYLNKSLGHFRDPLVAWVQAPSVYKNHDSWTSLGSSEQELVLQGPMQMGFYGHSDTPFIIGSHSTYRMSAIQEIGGFQPTRAEDHLDTLALASKGYKGVFIPEVIAEGDGPETLSIYLGQQFAWAYSMFQVLTTHSPKLLKRMSFKRRWQFLFAQTWYPLWSLTYLILFICPVIALIVGRNIARMHVGQFGAHFGPEFIAGFMVWWSSRPLMQPKNVFLSWRGMILHVVRWPIVLRAIVSSSFRIKKPYMITPKGAEDIEVPLIKTYRIFLGLGLLSIGAVIYSSIVHGDSTPEAQIIFALANAVLMLSVCIVDLGITLHQAVKQAKLTIFKLNFAWLKPIGATSVVFMLLVLSLLTSPLISGNLVYAFSKHSPVNSKHLLSVDQMSLNQILQKIHQVPTTPTSSPSLGFYNPSGPLKASHPYIQEAFASWDDDRYIAQQIYLSLEMHNTPLITIDPSSTVNGATLLQDIAAGQYDYKLKALANVLGSTKQTIYVRFAHEMDLGDVYPWAGQDPATFIAAYQHVVSFVRSNGAPNVKWVWSPAGNSVAAAYYPGNDYVDVVGTTILYDQYWSGSYQPTFKDLSSDRVWLESYNKPVWIVEFGVGRADPVFQSELINQAINQYHSLGFSALVYINMIDANLVGPNYTLNHISEFGSLFAPNPSKVVIKKPAVISKFAKKPKSTNNFVELFTTSRKTPY